MKNRYSGIVFDKDGTLFDFARTWEAWAQSILIRLAPDPDLIPVLGASIGFNTDTNRFAHDSPVIAGTPNEVAMALEGQLDGISYHDILQTLDAEAARAPQVEATPLVPLLQKLIAAGYTLGVATNDAQMPAVAHLNSAGVAELFDFVAGYDSGFGAKPEPGQLLAFAKHTVLDPAACIMVGDSLHDLRAGRAAGFATVGVLTGYAEEDDLAPFADVVLPDISFLPTWLQIV